MSTSAFALPLDTVPMEAKAAGELPSDAGLWQYEPKWDGFRCLAFKQGDAVDIRAKSGKPFGRYFPELVAPLQQLSARAFVVDGEILIELDGEFSFDALQMRLHPAESRIRKLAAETPAQVDPVRHADRLPWGRSFREPLTARSCSEAFVNFSNRVELSRHLGPKRRRRPG